jgi:hypothetical protein
MLGYCALIIVAFIAIPLLAAEPAPAKLAADLSLYPYLDRVDDDVDATLTVNARLPGRFSYFSYMNFRGIFGDGDAVFDRSEQNLRYALYDELPIDLNLQAVLVKGDGNDQWQLGIGWRLHDTSILEGFFERLNLTYRLTFQLKRFASINDDVWQMEHFFKINFPGSSARFYLSGFLDQNFNIDLPDTYPKHPIVTEIQFGARLFDHLYAVVEYRINEFRPSENHNAAVGIQYKFGW